MSTPRRDASPRYLAHVVPGLEHVVQAEIESTLPSVRRVTSLKRFDERTSLLIFAYPGAPQDLLGLGTVEDGFALAADVDGVPSTRVGLSVIRDALRRSKRLEQAAAAALSVRPRRRGKPTFRVVARMAGRHGYRRIDLQRAVELGILDRMPAWRLAEDNATIEAWAQLVGGRLILGFRLSDIEMRQRDYRQVSLPAALKPTIARAMVLLSEPREDDVFLDPMCGSGTILIERALTCPYRLLLGGDADPEALEATRANIGRRHKPIEIRHWDARSLPIDGASVSVLVTNLPFGKRIGTPEDNRSLYPALLREWSRVVQPAGRMVLLTSAVRLLRASLRRHPELAVRGEDNIIVRGTPAAVVTIQRA